MSTFWKFDQNDSISLAIRYILRDKKKNIYFQLQNEKFWLNVQDTYLAAFILNFMILKNEVDVKFRRCYNDETP